MEASPNASWSVATTRREAESANPMVPTTNSMVTLPSIPADLRLAGYTGSLKMSAAGGSTPASESRSIVASQSNEPEWSGPPPVRRRARSRAPREESTGNFGPSRSAGMRGPKRGAEPPDPGLTEPKARQWPDERAAAPEGPGVSGGAPGDGHDGAMAVRRTWVRCSTPGTIFTWSP